MLYIRQIEGGASHPSYFWQGGDPQQKASIAFNICCYVCTKQQCSNGRYEKIKFYFFHWSTGTSSNAIDFNCVCQFAFSYHHDNRSIWYTNDNYNRSHQTDWYNVRRLAQQQHRMRSIHWPLSKPCTLFYPLLSVSAIRSALYRWSVALHSTYKALAGYRGLNHTNKSTLIFINRRYSYYAFFYVCEPCALLIGLNR